MPRPRPGLLHVGIKGHVIALDRTTGAEVWRTKLTGVRARVYSFVHLHRDGDQLYAAFSGEVYCLDPATGAVRWHNQMRGLGTGLVSLLGEAAAGTPELAPTATLFEEHRRRHSSQHSRGGV